MFQEFQGFESMKDSRVKWLGVQGYVFGTGFDKKVNLNFFFLIWILLINFHNFFFCSLVKLEMNFNFSANLYQPNYRPRRFYNLHRFYFIYREWKSFLDSESRGVVIAVNKKQDNLILHIIFG